MTQTPSVDPRPIGGVRRLRTSLLASLLAGLVAGPLVILGWFWLTWTGGWTPPPSSPETVEVRIESGTTMRAAADTLRGQGLLRHPRVFLLGARLTGRDRDLKPGLFELPTGSSPRELLRCLVDGQPLPVVVTLTEGLEAGQLAAVLGAALGLDPGDILAAADSLVATALPAALPESAARRRLRGIVEDLRPDGSRLHLCEGYLAPDTYHFAEGVDAVAVARAVVGLQLARLDSASAAARAWPRHRPLEPHALLTLASIVEAEARLPDERGRVAAVYVNRLRRGMRLEADPTVAFWTGKRGERLYYRDLEVDGEYNTYRRAGLPPAPIGAAGRAALWAAARPDTSCDALYFVADGAGGHVFSRTLQEHQAAVARYRRLLRGAR